MYTLGPYLRKRSTFHVLTYVSTLKTLHKTMHQTNVQTILILIFDLIVCIHINTHTYAKRQVVARCVLCIRHLYYILGAISDKNANGPFIVSKMPLANSLLAILYNNKNSHSLLQMWMGNCISMKYLLQL